MTKWNKPKPPKPPPPTEPLHQVGVSVRDSNGNGLGNATGTIIPDTYDVSIPGVNNGTGRIMFTIPQSIPYPDWGYVATFKLDGYKDYVLRVIPKNAQSYDIVMQKLVVGLPRLFPNGQFFIKETGERITIIQCSDFGLYPLFLAGQDIRPKLKQRSDIGFNCVRNFGIGFPFDQHPDDYPNDKFYTELPQYASLLAEYGLYFEFVAFAGIRRIPKASDQLNYWNKLVSALQPITNVLLEAVNENDVPANTVSTLQVLPRPVGVISSHGSNGKNPGAPNANPPVSPFWDYATFHHNDEFEWQRKVGHNSMELWNGPTLANENTRAADRFQSANLAYDAAAGASLLCAGSCFHSVQGKTSELFTGLELELAKAWVAGAKSVPTYCQMGGYRHDAIHIQMENDENLMRVYQRGNDNACLVKIRK